MSLTNAKTILFFGAFLPQFVDPSLPFAIQLTVLSVTFWCLALLVNLAYMALAGKAAKLLVASNAFRWVHVTSGALYLGAAAALSAIRR